MYSIGRVFLFNYHHGQFFWTWWAKSSTGCSLCPIQGRRLLLQLKDCWVFAVLLRCVYFSYKKSEYYCGEPIPFSSSDFPSKQLFSSHMPRKRNSWEASWCFNRETRVTARMPRRRIIRKQTRIRAALAEPTRRNPPCLTCQMICLRSCTPQWRSIKRYYGQALLISFSSLTFAKFNVTKERGREVDHIK